MNKQARNANRKGRKDIKWQEAQNRKQEQERKDRRNRLIIFGVVAAVLVLLAGLLIGVLVNKDGGDTPNNSSDNDNKTSDSSDTSGLGNLGGIPFAKGGLQEPQKGDKVLDFFFDYTCAACVQAEYQYSDTIFELVDSGQLTFRLHPVGTHNEVFNQVASGALLDVVKAEPDKAEAFHKALLKRIFDTIQEAEGKSQDEANQLFAFYSSPDMAQQVVKDVAKQANISDEVISSFNMETGKSEIESRTQAWVEWCQANDAKTATPQMWLNGKTFEIFTEDKENPGKSRYLTPEEFKEMLVK